MRINYPVSLYFTFQDVKSDTQLTIGKINGNVYDADVM